MPEELDDDGTMPANVVALAEHVVGHRIVSVEKGDLAAHVNYITLDNGKRVLLADTSDCCAYTELKEFLLHADRIDHIITGVATTEGYTTWHVLADYGDVLEMKVGWSCGNPFYYSYGFSIAVEPEPTKATV